MKIAITSGRGYIARALMREALLQQCNVKCLSRQPSNITGVSHVNYDLSQPIDGQTLSDVEVVIHLAAFTQNYSAVTHEIEFTALKELHSMCKQKNVFFIYISSLSAAKFSPTQYGRTKYILEQYVLENGGTVVRPGFVFGGEKKGLYGFLYSLTALSQFVPDFKPALYFQPVHITDLCKSLLIIARLRKSGAYNIAKNERLSLTTFMQLVARCKLHKNSIRIPVPWKFLALLAGAARTFIPSLPDLKRLHALHSNVFVDTSDSLSALKITLPSVEYSLEHEHTS